MKCGDIQFSEKRIRLSTGEYHAFDAVSGNRSIVAAFVCNRAKTATGKENTGGVRKVLYDLHLLNLAVTAKKRFLVFTDKDFLRLIRRRGKRGGTSGIKFFYCKLPQKLATGLKKVLDKSSEEQTGRKRH
ncbi:MAG: hypothetical protein V3W19_05060 [Desulfatiglandales bacterium]